MIFTQSTTAFGAFILQLGLRAGLRKELVEGRTRVVASTSIFFVNSAHVVALGASTLYLQITELSTPVFFVLIAANASLTLQLGLDLINDKLRNAAIVSVKLFAVNLTAVVVVLTVNEISYIEYIGLELFSLSLGISWSRQRGSLRRLGKATYLVVLKYIGLQVSAFLLLLGMYLFSLVVTKLTILDVEVGQRYAELSFVANIAILLIGRYMMVYERELIERKLIYISLTGLCALFGLATAAYLVVISTQEIISLVILGQLLGNYVFSMLSHFIKEEYRVKFLLMSLLVPLQGIYILWLISVNNMYWSTYLINYYFLSVVVLVWYFPRRDKVFIEFRTK